MPFSKNVDDIIASIYNNFSRFNFETEVVELDNLENRILAEDIYAKQDFPSFSRSAVEGYAVLASDVLKARRTNPARLKLIGESSAASITELVVESKQTAYVPINGIVPKGADAVIAFEPCEILGDEVLIQESIAQRSNIVPKGHDAKKSKILIRKLKQLTTKDICILAALGITEAVVFKKLKCGVIVTGNELAEATEQIDGNSPKVRDVSSYAIRSLITNWGGEVVLYGIVEDEKLCLINNIKKAFKQCDMVIVSGGVSACKESNTLNAIDSIGNIRYIARRIAARPGKQTTIAMLNAKPIIATANHDVSVFFVMTTIVKHIFYAINGLNENCKPYPCFCPYPCIEAILSDDIYSTPDKDEFFAVSIDKNADGQLTATPQPMKSSSIVLIANADGYVSANKGCNKIHKGDVVRVQIF